MPAALVLQIHRLQVYPLWGVRVLEALRILKAATVECKVRSIETPEVREALDLLDPYCASTLKCFSTHWRCSV
jgi:hypothetical protein